nr:MAG TPA: hypothetical protein [Caudoviricetes sp.]
MGFRAVSSGFVCKTCANCTPFFLPLQKVKKLWHQRNYF